MSKYASHKHHVFTAGKTRFGLAHWKDSVTETQEAGSLRDHFDGFELQVNYMAIRQALYTSIVDQLPADCEERHHTRINDNNTISMDWYSSDDEVKFKKHLDDPESRKLLQKYNWVNPDGTPKSIDYSFNRYGFRGDNPTDAPKALFVGCSHTLGVGLNTSQTFAHKVADALELECANLGRPGTGFDVSAMYVSLFLKKEYSNIKAMFCYMPPAGRKGTLVPAVPGNKQTLLSLAMTNTGVLSDADIAKWLSTEYDTITHNTACSSTTYNEFLFMTDCMQAENSFLREYMAISTIKLFCKENNIPFILLNPLDVMECATNRDLARDLGHHGEKHHSAIAREFLELYTKHK